MPKTITIKMSRESINDAIEELKKYHEDFIRKLDLFTRTLITDGVAVARTYIQFGAGNKRQADVSWQVNSNGDICRAMISMTGRDCAFIEFGAGIHYNPSDTPHAAEHGMGIGTFPDQTHAFDDYWWYYDSNGNSVYTHGTLATMPIYHAEESITNNAILRALQIFRS